MTTPRRLRTRHRDAPVNMTMGTKQTFIKDKFGGGEVTPEEDVIIDSFQMGSRGKTWQELCRDELHPGPPFKTGGPFDKWELTDLGLSKQAHALYEDTLSHFVYRYEYNGGFVCKLTPFQVFSGLDSGAIAADFPEDSAFGEVCSLGPEAWNKFKPGKPTSDIANFLGEIKEVPRMMLTSAFAFRNLYRELRNGQKTGIKLSKSAAEHHLNTQFGWLPFVGDLRRFYNTFMNLSEQMNQLRKDNGQWVKRAGTFRYSSEIVKDEKTDHDSGLLPYLGLNWTYPIGGSVGDYRITVRQIRRCWFAGRFKYYIPALETPYWPLKAVQHLFGARVNPEVIWNLTPFTWLVDWFSNAGDVIANFSDHDNLVAKYAYVMGKTSLDGSVVCRYNIQPKPLLLEFKYTLERKTRCVANPFGFDLSWGDLSARQWSLLGAVGLSRLKSR